MALTSIYISFHTIKRDLRSSANFGKYFQSAEFYSSVYEKRRVRLETRLLHSNGKPHLRPFTKRTTFFAEPMDLINLRQTKVSESRKICTRKADLPPVWMSIVVNHWHIPWFVHAVYFFNLQPYSSSPAQYINSIFSSKINIKSCEETLQWEFDVPMRPETHLYRNYCKLPFFILQFGCQKLSQLQEPLGYSRVNLFVPEDSQSASPFAHGMRVQDRSHLPVVRLHITTLSNKLIPHLCPKSDNIMWNMLLGVVRERFMARNKEIFDVPIP